MELITREWLMKCRTSRGGWTRAQLELLGVSWPPTRDWLKKLLGKRITREEMVLVERAKTITR